MSYIGETSRNFEFRVDEHLDRNKQSEPARHVKENLSHAFEWRTLTIVQNWHRRRINEALHSAAYCPVLNRQVKSFEPTRFSKGIGIT